MNVGEEVPTSQLNTDFLEAIEFNDVPLDERVRQSTVPLLSIFGTEDQICDPEQSQAAYETVPGARIAEIDREVKERTQRGDIRLLVSAHDYYSLCPSFVLLYDDSRILLPGTPVAGFDGKWLVHGDVLVTAIAVPARG